MSSRSRKTIRIFIKKALTYFLVFLMCASLVVAAVVIWTFEVKLKRWPSMMFGAPTTIRVGDNLNDLQFYTRLSRLGYSKVQSLSPTVGEWGQSGTELKIFLRYSLFVGDGPIEGPISISLQVDTIKSIRLMRSLEEVKHFELEPELIGVIPAKGRTPELCIPIRLDQAPSLLIDSVLLTEDNRFYTHSGIDIVSIYRALISNLQAGRYVQGASTITQQLIRMTLLNPEKTLWRKSLEIALSIGADAIYSKKTILEAYLNRVYLGHFGQLPVAGISEAARNFFGKSLDQLDASECALIAAIIRAPNVINPFRHPERAQARRNMILGLLFKHGKIPRDTYEDAISKSVQMAKPGASPPRVGAFVEMARQQLLVDDSASAPPRTFIATSLDPAMQASVEARLRQLGESGQQAYAIIVNPQTGSLLVYVTPVSERWDGRGGNLQLFAPMALVPAFTPRKVNDPFYTLASQIISSDSDRKRLAFSEAFRTDKEGLIGRIIEVMGVDKVLSVLREFKINSRTVDGSEIVIQPMTPLEVAQSYSVLASLGSAGIINCKRPSSGASIVQTNSRSKIRLGVPSSVLFIVNSLIREQQSVKDMNDGPQKLLLIPSFLFTMDNWGSWSIAYQRDSLALLRIQSKNITNKIARNTTLEILPSPSLEQGRDLLVPTGLVFRKLCFQSGLRATSTCPQITLDPFLAGTQPDEWCGLRHESKQRPETMQKTSTPQK